MTERIGPSASSSSRTDSSATELLNAAEMIVGDLPRFAAVSIGWHDDVTVAQRGRSRDAIAKVDRGAGVLLLTDMFGGTPSNLGLAFLDAGPRRGRHRREPADADQARAKAPATADLTTLARGLCEHGRAAIRVASDLLRADRDARGAQTSLMTARQVVDRQPARACTRAPRRGSSSSPSTFQQPDPRHARARGRWTARAFSGCSCSPRPAARELVDQRRRPGRGATRSTRSAGWSSADSRTHDEARRPRRGAGHCRRPRGGRGARRAAGPVPARVERRGSRAAAAACRARAHAARARGDLVARLAHDWPRRRRRSSPRSC